MRNIDASKVARERMRNFEINRKLYVETTAGMDEFDHHFFDNQLIGAMMAYVGPKEFSAIVEVLWKGAPVK